MELLIKLAMLSIPAEIIGIAVIQKIKPMLNKKWAVNVISLVLLGALGFFNAYFLAKYGIAESIISSLITIGGAEVIYQQLNLKSLAEIKEMEPVEIEVEDIIDIER